MDEFPTIKLNYADYQLPDDGTVTDALLRWSMADPRPLVLLIDEIDALVGDTLLAVLRQLRTGYVDRPARRRRAGYGLGHVKLPRR